MNLFKKIISQQRDQTDLPEDFGWDQMSDGIYERVGQLEKDAQSPKQDRDHKLKWLLLLLLLIGGVWGCNKLMNINADQSNQIDKSIDYAREDYPEPEIPTTETAELSSKNGSANMFDVIDSEKKTTKEATKDRIEQTIDQQALVENELIILMIEEAIEESIAKTMVHIESKDGMSEKAIIESVSLDLYPLWVQDIVPFQIMTEYDLSAQLPAYADIEGLKTEEKLKNRWMVGMFSGTSIRTPIDQTLSDMPALMIGESSLPSFSFGAGVSFKLSRSLFVEGAMNWTKYYTRYDLTEIRTSPINVENQIVEIRTNPLTGRSRAILGSVPTTLVETRQFRKYNSLGLISMNLRIGWESQFNRFNTRLYASVQASRAISGTGKAYVGEQIIEYDQYTDRYETSTDFGIGTGLRVSYDISSLVNVGIDLGYNHYLTQASTLNAQRFNPCHLGASFSIGYRL